MSSPLPCPYCGARATIAVSELGANVLCMQCFASGPMRGTQAEAEEDWDRVAGLANGAENDHR